MHSPHIFRDKSFLETGYVIYFSCDICYSLGASLNVEVVLVSYFRAIVISIKENVALISASLIAITALCALIFKTIPDLRIKKHERPIRILSVLLAVFIGFVNVSAVVITANDIVANSAVATPTIEIAKATAMASVSAAKTAAPEPLPSTEAASPSPPIATTTNGAAAPAQTPVEMTSEPTNAGVSTYVAASSTAKADAEEPTRLPIASIEASSVRQASTTKDAQGNHFTYEAENLIDGKPGTCWTPSYTRKLSREAIGETVEIVLSAPASVSEISILNGYAAEKDIYYANSRVRTMEISFRRTGKDYFADSIDFELKNNIWDEYQTIAFSPRENVEAVKFQIKSVYEGTRYVEDVCISEIAIYGNLTP